MDKNTWENLPVGTNVVITFPDMDPYTAIRSEGDGGASHVNFGLYGGEHWNTVLAWLAHGAEFEVIFTPTSKEN